MGVSAPLVEPEDDRGFAPRLLLLTAAHNEEHHVAALVAGVVSQSRLPDRWVIVDDASTDATFEEFGRRVGELDWVTVLRHRVGRHGVADRLAEAAEARALNWALGHVDLGQYSHVGKLDADVALPGDFIEQLLSDFAADASLGMTAGVLTELRGGVWRRVVQPITHPPAPARLYTRACFEASGGFRERLAWDTMDETYARMRGFSTLTNPSLRVRHMRTLGTADGRLRGRARHGECAWILHHPPLWVLLRSIKVALSFTPRGASGLAFLWGYGRAALLRVPRVDDAAFRRFVRRDLRTRMVAPAARILSRVGGGA